MLSKRIDRKSATGTKRSDRLIMTNESRALKEMRLAAGLSMRKAAKLLGKSDSYIAHIETGRLDVPKGEKLQSLLNIYGGIKLKSFYEKSRKYSEVVRPRDELIELVSRASDDRIRLLLTFARSLIS